MKFSAFGLEREFFKRVTSTSKSLQMKNIYPFITSTNNLQETMLMLGVVVTKRCSLKQVCIKSSLEQFRDTPDQRMTAACHLHVKLFQENNLRVVKSVPIVIRFSPSPSCKSLLAHMIFLTCASSPISALYS